MTSSPTEMSDVPDDFWIPPERLTSGKTLGEGHYGAVVQGTYNNTAVAIKMMKGKVHFYFTLK